MMEAITVARNAAESVKQMDTIDYGGPEYVLAEAALELAVAAEVLELRVDVLERKVRDISSHGALT